MVADNGKGEQTTTTILDGTDRAADGSGSVLAIRELFRPLTDEVVLNEPLGNIHDWNQRQRDMWIEQRAKSVAPGSSVLDIGAGTCPYRAFFNHCVYRAHDFKAYHGPDYLKRDSSLAQDGYGAIDIVSDINAIPVASASYDVALCTEVFEHIPEPIRALEEIGRILKPGARLFLTAPLASGLHQLPYHFYGGFTPEWYRHFAPQAGLSIVTCEPLGGFFKMLSQECARFSWTIEQHRDLHGERADSLSLLFSDILSRYFYALDERRCLENFTAGYLLEMRRFSSLDEIQSAIDSDPGNERLYRAASRLALDLKQLSEARSYIEDLIELQGNTQSGAAFVRELEMKTEERR